jgi:hypothetical protein
MGESMVSGVLVVEALVDAAVVAEESAAWRLALEATNSMAPRRTRAGLGFGFIVRI